MKYNGPRNVILLSFFFFNNNPSSAINIYKEVNEFINGSTFFFISIAYENLPDFCSKNCHDAGPREFLIIMLQAS